MKLLEYEAKALLAGHDIRTPQSQLLTSVNSSISLPLPVVAKAQVPIGGRGKAGGIRKATTEAERHAAISGLFGAKIRGYDVKAILLEELLPIKQEFYLALAIDREAKTPVLLVHSHGGVEIEDAMQLRAMHRLALSHAPTEATAGEIGRYLSLPTMCVPQLHHLLTHLWEVFVQDALLVEINPLVLTTKNELYCADAKIVLDDAASYRHPEWQFTEAPASTQFSLLRPDGEVASMANGAGLAMATIDAIEAAGLKATNFFDVGGGTSVDGMVAAFEKIARIPAVKAIVINIFAGITRCDEVAQAIIAAQTKVAHMPALCVRLSGTNEAEGKALLAGHGIRMQPSLAACVQQAAAEVGNA